MSGSTGGEGCLQLLQMVQQRGLAVDVQRRAVRLGECADGHVLAVEDAVLVVEMVHDVIPCGMSFMLLSKVAAAIGHSKACQLSRRFGFANVHYMSVSGAESKSAILTNVLCVRELGGSLTGRFLTAIELAEFVNALASCRAFRQDCDGKCS